MSWKNVLIFIVFFLLILLVVKVCLGYLGSTYYDMDGVLKSDGKVIVHGVDEAVEMYSVDTGYLSRLNNIYVGCLVFVMFLYVHLHYRVCKR